MTTLTMRSYAGEGDLEAIADLFSACEVVNQLNENISVTELRQALNEPSMDKERGLCIWEDTDGQLMGCGWVSILPLADDVIDTSHHRREEISTHHEAGHRGLSI